MKRNMKPFKLEVVSQHLIKTYFRCELVCMSGKLKLSEVVPMFFRDTLNSTLVRTVFIFLIRSLFYRNWNFITIDNSEE